MKTVLALVSLIVLSSVCIYAQKDYAPETLLASTEFADPPASSDEMSLHDFLKQQLNNTTLWSDQPELNAPLTEGIEVVLRQSNTDKQETGYESPFIPMLLEDGENEVDFHQRLLAQEVQKPVHEPRLENLHRITDSNFLKNGGLKWVIVK